MPKLKFYDLKNKNSFETDKFKLIQKKTSRGIRFFAITESPSGIKSYRIISKDFFNKFS